MSLSIVPSICADSGNWKSQSGISPPQTTLAPDFYTVQNEQGQCLSLNSGSVAWAACGGNAPLILNDTFQLSQNGKCLSQSKCSAVTSVACTDTSSKRVSLTESGVYDNGCLRYMNPDLSLAPQLTPTIRVAKAAYPLPPSTDSGDYQLFTGGYPNYQMALVLDSSSPGNLLIMVPSTPPPSFGISTMHYEASTNTISLLDDAFVKWYLADVTGSSPDTYSVGFTKDASKAGKWLLTQTQLINIASAPDAPVCLGSTDPLSGTKIPMSLCLYAPGNIQVKTIPPKPVPSPIADGMWILQNYKNTAIITTNPDTNALVISQDLNHRNQYAWLYYNGHLIRYSSQGTPMFLGNVTINASGVPQPPVLSPDSKDAGQWIVSNSEDGGYLINELVTLKVTDSLDEFIVQRFIQDIGGDIDAVAPVYKYTSQPSGQYTIEFGDQCLGADGTLSTCPVPPQHPVLWTYDSAKQTLQNDKGECLLQKGTDCITGLLPLTVGDCGNVAESQRFNLTIENTLADTKCGLCYTASPETPSRVVVAHGLLGGCWQDQNQHWKESLFSSKKKWILWALVGVVAALALFFAWKALQKKQ